MSFSEKINSLQCIYRKQHDLSNQIANAAFADVRGHLSEEDKKDIEQKQKEFEQFEKEEISLRKDITIEFPEEYKQHLTTTHTKLTAIQNYLNAFTGALEFKQSFHKTLCESLLPDLSKVLKDKKPKNSFHWIFDVSGSLIEEYKIIF
jgi:hypothetical protein